MRDSWRQFFRRLAAVTIAGGATAWSSAVCYAAQLAYDTASDPVYADGWQAGDNGGFGFEPWNFDTDTIFTVTPGNQLINSTSPFNNIGTAWTLSMPDQQALPRAGRGFTPLEVGQTIRVIVDNPNEEKFFKGYFIRFNTRLGLPGGGNICYGGDPCTAGTSPLPKMNLQMFEYFTYGNWSVQDSIGTPTTLYDTDKVVAGQPVVGTDKGMQVDLTLTGAETYNLKMTPLNNPGAAYMQSGVLATPGDPIDWIEFTMFNTPMDPNFATDFYIRSMEILDSATASVPGDYNSDGKVDAADYTVWRDHLGQTFQLPNEVAGVTPGMVTMQDYIEWKNRFGNMAGGGTSLGRAVPEPSTGVYLIAGIGGVAGFHYRKGVRHRKGNEHC